MALRLPGWWQDLASPEFARLDPATTVAVLPAGAIEQHGPHLPVAVDTCINDGIVRRALTMSRPACRCWCYRPRPWARATSTSISPARPALCPPRRWARVWYEIGASVRRAGIRKLLLFNSHGGQPQVMQIVARELRIDHGC